MAAEFEFLLDENGGVVVSLGVEILPVLRFGDIPAHGSAAGVLRKEK